MRLNKLLFLSFLIPSIICCARSNTHKDAEYVRHQLVKSFTAGDTTSILANISKFSEKSIRTVPSLTKEQLVQIAKWLDDAVLVSETSTTRTYRYSWTDNNGDNFAEFQFTKDEFGNWKLSSL